MTRATLSHYRKYLWAYYPLVTPLLLQSFAFLICKSLQTVEVSPVRITLSAVRKMESKMNRNTVVVLQPFSLGDVLVQGEAIKGRRIYNHVAPQKL